ncbi:hypothetical protein [Nitrosopumilus sp.]|uniref:hypothetical protein n=1 Tax=Nitrosopumilus sp. TaxID=2024843 RepID=UPI003D0E6D58
MHKVYQILKKFNPKKDYGFDIRPQYARCLEVMCNDDKVNANEFAKKHRGEFVTRKNTMEANLAVVHKAISFGKKLGLLQEIPTDSTPILYKDFCQLETVSHFRSQLRGSNRRNTKSNTDGTRDTYTRHLHYFNNWIFGKSLEYTKEVSAGNDTYKKTKQKVTLKGVENFLQIYAQSHYDKKPFVRLIKSYFLDSDTQTKSKAMRNNSFFAINEYFKKNEEPIELTFDPNAGLSLDDGDLEQIMTLDEFLKILTLGRPSITERAVFLCKFQRGLDSSTLVDRFNFEAWSQLVEEFGTDDYTKWDLKKCPVFVGLRRVKTNISHGGFLDRDSISALIDYLRYRKKITGKEISAGQALFLNNFQKPINEVWITQSFGRMRKNAGLDEILNPQEVENGARKKYRITSHETRDLLKSVLVDSDVRYDLCEEYIGHKTGDSYEKQTKMFDVTMRKEYIKASGRLNIFSKFQEISKGVSSEDEMREKLKEVEAKMEKMNKRISRTDKLRRKKSR